MLDSDWISHSGIVHANGCFYSFSKICTRLGRMTVFLSLRPAEYDSVVVNDGISFIRPRRVPVGDRILIKMKPGPEIQPLNIKHLRKIPDYDAGLSEAQEHPTKIKVTRSATEEKVVWARGTLVGTRRLDNLTGDRYFLLVFAEEAQIGYSNRV